MFRPKYQVRLEHSVSYGGHQVFLFREEDGARAALDSEGFQELKDGDYFNPGIMLDDQAAQQLMDDLWRGGLRPTEGRGSAGSLVATERHLEDMRSLVFNKLKVEKP